MEPLEKETSAAPVSGSYRFDAKEFPWWLVVMLGLIALMIWAILANAEYREAFKAIFPVPLALTRGIIFTLILTVGSFIAATLLGLFIGLGRISRRPLRRNVATVYIELVRGIPMLVFIFAVALVLTPDFIDLANSFVRKASEPTIDLGTVATTQLPLALAFGVAGVLLLAYLSSPERGDAARLIVGALVIIAIGAWFFPEAVLIQARLLLLVLALFALAAPTFYGGQERARARYLGAYVGAVILVTVALIWIGSSSTFAGDEVINRRAITQAWRGAAALSLFYAAFIAEVFRAGIQSVPAGQAEAGRAVGLSEGQIMWRIILPQAVRNMLPALGNDLIALMKDTSLVSVLAVRELTQQARLYSGSTFRFRESFFIIMAIYVILTLILSLLLRWYERRIAIPEK